MPFIVGDYFILNDDVYELLEIKIRRGMSGRLKTFRAKNVFTNKICLFAYPNEYLYRVIPFYRSYQVVDVVGNAIEYLNEDFTTIKYIIPTNDEIINKVNEELNAGHDVNIVFFCIDHWALSKRKFYRIEVVSE